MENNEITCPSGKPRFKTKAEIKRWIANQCKRNGGKKYDYFYCKECGGWHLTTRTVCQGYMLYKKSKQYNRVTKKANDMHIFQVNGII